MNTNEQPFHYDQIFYNQLLYFIEQNWNRKLNEAEKAVAIYAYRFGRYIEMEMNV